MNSKPTEIGWSRSTREGEQPILGTLYHLTSKRPLGQSTLAEAFESFPNETIQVDFTPWPTD